MLQLCSLLMQSQLKGLRGWGETAAGLRRSLYICIKSMTSRATRVLLIDASAHISIHYVYMYVVWVRAQCQCTRFLRLYAVRILNVPQFRLPRFVVRCCCCCCLCIVCRYDIEQIALLSALTNQAWYTEDDVIGLAWLGLAWLLSFGLVWATLRRMGPISAEGTRITYTHTHTHTRVHTHAHTQTHFRTIIKA